MLAGYADEHVEAAIVDGLRRNGMDMVTVQERNQDQEQDEVLLATATGEGRVMISRDKDFLRIHSEWMNAGQSHAGILFLRPSLSIGEAIRRIVAFASATDAADARDALKFV